MEQSLGHKAAAGAVWASIDRFGMMVLQFVVNLILARLLLPADFGAIGMLAIFIAVSTTLIDGGFGSALIQKKNPTQTDYSTIFYWNIAFSALLYSILFIVAPLIADYFAMPVLSGVLRGIGLTLIINAVLAVQKVKLQKTFAFRILAITDLSSYIVGSGVGTFMAHKGGGVWSLVAMQIVYGLIAVIMFAFITRWFPSLCFSKRSVRELFGFGGYIMAANILQEICRNLQGFIIGKKFSATQMGYFSQAYKLENITSYSLPQVIVQVMYPVYSSLQDDRQRLSEVVAMNMRVIAFVVYPVLALLILAAQPLIEFLYGSKWLPSVPYFQVLCVGGFFISLQNINFYAVAAVGKSKSLFKWSLYKWGYLLTALLVGMNFGMYGILWGMVTSSLNIFLVNSFLASKYTGLTVRRQLLSVLSVALLTSLCFIAGYGMSLLGINIIIVSLTCISAYLLIGACLKIRALNDTIIVLKNIINR